MRNFNFLSRKNIPAVLAVALGSFAVAGCTNPEGTGNDFHLRGKIENVGEQSITVRTKQILQEDGESEDWFSVGDHNQLHDNCDCHGIFNSRKQYGSVYALGGTPSELSSLKEGQCVDAIGKVRDDDDGKTYHTRAVFDKVTVIDCSLIDEL